MRIVFWNVNKKDLTNEVCLLAKANDADVVVLLENTVPESDLLSVLQKSVAPSFYLPAASASCRFSCYCRKKTLDLSEVHAGIRTSVRSLRSSTGRILLSFVHGVDVRNNDAETRQSSAQELATEMSFVITQQQTNKLLLVGDFNMNPYDRGMNLRAGMNAMMTRACTRNRVRKHHGKKYDFYYNPMWSLFGDNTEGPAGTVYDTSNQGPYGWSMFDQVVMNYSVIEHFESVKILTTAGDVSLADKNGRPNAKTASDHFPILVVLRD